MLANRQPEPIVAANRTTRRLSCPLGERNLARRVAPSPVGSVGLIPRSPSRRARCPGHRDHRGRLHLGLHRDSSRGRVKQPRSAVSPARPGPIAPRRCGAGDETSAPQPPLGRVEVWLGFWLPAMGLAGMVLETAPPTPAFSQPMGRRLPAGHWPPTFSRGTELFQTQPSPGNRRRRPNRPAIGRHAARTVGGENRVVRRPDSGRRIGCHGS